MFTISMFQFYLLHFFHIVLSFLVFRFFHEAHFSCYIFPYFTLPCYSPPCYTHFKFQSFQVALFSCCASQRHRDIKFRLVYLRSSKNIVRNISSVWTKSQQYLARCVFGTHAMHESCPDTEFYLVHIF